MSFIRNVIMCFFVIYVFSFSNVYGEENSTNIALPTQNTNEVEKLELAGEDSFEYDISEKIRKTKSGVNVGIGANFVYNIQENAIKINASTILGYSYFFHKTFGLKLHGIFDNNQRGFYSGVGMDIIWDFVQTEQFGMGILIGSSMGYKEYYISGKQGQLLGQFHSGLGFVFDSGRSRIDGIVRIPYNRIELSNKVYANITYILMYSYTF